MTPADAADSTGGIDDAATRQRLTPPAIAGFLGVAARWRLSIEEQQVLLGVDRMTMREWQRPSATAAALSADELARVSLVLAVYEGLERVLRRAPAEADAWIRRPNAEAPFDGRSPLDFLLEGGRPALEATRAHIDDWTGGPPVRDTRPAGS